MGAAPGALEAAKSNEHEEVGDILKDAGEVPDREILEPELKKHREDTARALAIGLVSMLGLSFLIHYAALIFLYWNQKPDVADKLSTFMNAWLPVVSGLVGSATTYYFTKQRQ